MFLFTLKALGPYKISIILVFHFACFDFQNNYVMVYSILFKPSTVSHMLEVDMNQDYYEFGLYDLSKVL